MRRANEAIVREIHPILNVEEVLQELNENAYVSELDFRSEYHQIVLEENSRDITTFVTPQGHFRYKRLFFGVSSAPEKFHNIIERVFSGLEGIRNISDNMTVFGKDEEEHDRKCIANSCRSRLKAEQREIQVQANRIGVFRAFVLSEGN